MDMAAVRAQAVHRNRLDVDPAVARTGRVLLLVSDMWSLVAQLVQLCVHTHSSSSGDTPSSCTRLKSGHSYYMCSAL